MTIKSETLKIENNSAFNILTGEPTGYNLIGRPRNSWEENIRMDFQEIGIDMKSGAD